MELSEAEAVEVHPKTKEKRIDPNHPYRIHGPTKIRIGSSQFLAIPDKRPGDAGRQEHHLLLYSLDANGNLVRVDGEPQREWLDSGDTMGRGEGNRVKLPDPLVSRDHAKFTLGVEHQGEGTSNRIKNLLGRAGGPSSWAITDIGSKNGTFVTRVDPPKNL